MYALSRCSYLCNRPNDDKPQITKERSTVLYDMPEPCHSQASASLLQAEPLHQLSHGTAS